MWCQHCRQDLPVGLFATGKTVCCALCGMDLPERRVAGSRASLSLAAGVNVAARPLSAAESWVIDEDLRHAARIVSPLLGEVPAPADAGAILDEALSDGPDGCTSPVRQASRLLTFLSSMLVGLGLAALFCGTLLAIWERAGGRPALGTVGMPGMVGAIGGILLGLALMPRHERQPPADIVRPVDVGTPIC
jgi:hypothetical protein